MTLEGEQIQQLRSPNGQIMGGVCVNDDYVWVVGQPDDPSPVHIFRVG
jgi:hypothetical protein